MKLLSFIRQEKVIYIAIALFSFFAILPYIIATLYIQPNADDFTFSKEVNDLGIWEFIGHYYQTWSGRFFAFFLLAAPKSHIIESGYWYSILPNLFILLTGFTLYKILTIFLSNTLKKWKIAILSLLFLSFYITGLREVFSALFWNCSSYYLIANVFFMWFIYEFLNFILHHHSIKSFNFLKLFILAFLVCGLTEIYIVSLIVVIIAVQFYQYQRDKKINLALILLITIICIGGYLNILSPGSLNRMEVSKSDGGLPFIYSSYRALYNLIILQIAPLLYSGFLFILLLILMYGNDIAKNNQKLKSFLNINPLFTATVVFFIFYLHHAMSLYGAGYVLQGRVLNITNLLLYLSLMFVTLNTVIYYNINSFSPIKNFGLFSLIGLAFIMNFSENSRIVGKEALVDFPILNTEMNLRYQKIIKAKTDGKETVYIDRVSVDLRSLYLGYEFTKNQSYYNSEKICRDLTMFFDINVEIKDNDYDLLPN